MYAKKIVNLYMPILHNPKLLSGRGEYLDGLGNPFNNDTELFYWSELLRETTPPWMDITPFLVFGQALRFIDTEREAGHSLIKSLESVPVVFKRPVYLTSVLQKFLWKTLVDELPFYLFTNGDREQFRTFTPILRYDSYTNLFYYDQQGQKSCIHATTLYNAWQIAVTLYLRNRETEINQLILNAKHSFAQLETDHWLIGHLVRQNSKNKTNLQTNDGVVLAEYDTGKSCYLIHSGNNAFYLPSDNITEQPYLILAGIAEKYTSVKGSKTGELSSPIMPDYCSVIVDMVFWLRALIKIDPTSNLPRTIPQGVFDDRVNNEQVSLQVQTQDKTWELSATLPSYGVNGIQLIVTAETDAQMVYYRNALVRIVPPDGDSAGEETFTFAFGSLVSLLAYINYEILPKQKRR